MREKIRNIRETLNKDIFVGDRYEKNLRNMASTSLILMAIGLVMTAVNVIQGQYYVALSTVAFFLCGLVTYIIIKRYRTREIAVITTIAAIVFVLTVDVLFVENGFAYLWTLLVPLVACYIFSVKTGILLTAYFQALFMIVFYTPVRQFVAPHYPEIVMDRFPLLYFFHGLMVLFVMYQYQKSVLAEIEYTDKLNAEVERQTAVAEERSRRIEQMSLQTIQTLANAIDAKDPYTKGHSTRVSQYSVMLAEALGWDKDRISDLRYSALLHDIGKIGVPDSILNNPKRLTEVEYGIVKSHTTMGGDIFKDRIMIRSAEDVARSHHERYDGKGYPGGLKGEEISEEARIVAIADAFDAMNTNRVYRKACDPAYIRSEILEGRGKQFDPQFADLFITLWDAGKLDRILRKEEQEPDTQTEVPAALLQEVMEAFASQNGEGGFAFHNGEPDTAQNEETDISRLVERIRTSGSYDGAMDVEYRQFAKLYEYIGNLGKRFSQPFLLVMITLKTMPGKAPHPDEVTNAMYYMEQAIRQTIRSVDVLTRYSRQQFLIIFLGTDTEGVRIAADRIFKGYFKMYGSGDFLPTYSVANVEETGDGESSPEAGTDGEKNSR